MEFNDRGKHGACEKKFIHLAEPDILASRSQGGAGARRQRTASCRDRAGQLRVQHGSVGQRIIHLHQDGVVALDNQRVVGMKISHGDYSGATSPTRKS